MGKRIKRWAAVLLASMLVCGVCGAWGEGNTAVYVEDRFTVNREAVMNMLGEMDDESAAIFEALIDFAQQMVFSYWITDDSAQLEMLVGDMTILSFGTVTDEDGVTYMTSLLPTYDLKYSYAGALSVMGIELKGETWDSATVLKVSEAFEPYVTDIENWLEAFPMKERTGRDITTGVYAGAQVVQTVTIDKASFLELTNMWIARLEDDKDMAQMLDEVFVNVSLEDLKAELDDTYDSLLKGDDFSIVMEAAFTDKMNMMEIPLLDMIGFSVSVYNEQIEVFTLALGSMGNDGYLECYWNPNTYNYGDITASTYQTTSEALYMRGYFRADENADGSVDITASLDIYFDEPGKTFVKVLGDTALSFGIALTGQVQLDDEGRLSGQMQCYLGNDFNRIRIDESFEGTIDASGMDINLEASVFIEELLPDEALFTVMEHVYTAPAQEIERKEAIDLYEAMVDSELSGLLDADMEYGLKLMMARLFKALPESVVEDLMPVLFGVTY